MSRPEPPTRSRPRTCTWGRLPRTSGGGGIGLSHAFGTPSYEDGPRDDPARRYHTQLLILVNMEWKLSTATNWSLLMRVHHRSGAYGLIAPPKVGSNFLAIGLRYSL